MFAAVFVLLLVSTLSYDCPEARKFGPGEIFSNEKEDGILSVG